MGSLPKRLAVVLLLLGAFDGTADVGHDAVVSGMQQRLLDEAQDQAGRHSFAPVVGYDPTFKFVFGAAYFFTRKSFSVGVDANTNFGHVYQAHLSIHHGFADRWEYGLRLGVTEGFEPFFGEGGETLVSSFVKLWGTHSNNRVHVAFKPSPIYSVGLFADGRIRTERPGPGGPPGRLYPDETTLGIGIFQKVDTRENKQDPHDGFVFGTAFTYVPKTLSSLAGVSDFAQIEADFIVYKEILNQVIPDVIAAFQLTGGYTFGDPSFAFNYRLGGAAKLRGFFENRFRGKKYYLQQTELRFPIWRMFSGVGFVGFGDATDGDFTNAKLGYGFGVRLGLPPDWISKIRVDFGFTRDQAGIFADFGHVF